MTAPVCSSTCIPTTPAGQNINFTVDPLVKEIIVGLKANPEIKKIPNLQDVTTRIVGKLKNDQRKKRLPVSHIRNIVWNVEYNHPGIPFYLANPCIRQNSGDMINPVDYVKERYNKTEREILASSQFNWQAVIDEFSK